MPDTQDPTPQNRDGDAEQPRDEANDPRPAETQDSELSEDAIRNHPLFQREENKRRQAEKEAIERRKKLQELRTQLEDRDDPAEPQNELPVPADDDVPAWARQLSQKLESLEQGIQQKEQRTQLETLQAHYELSEADMELIGGVVPDKRDALAQRLTKKTFADNSSTGNRGKDGEPVNPMQAKLRARMKARAEGRSEPSENPFDVALQRRIGGGVVTPDWNKG
jgi:hypothetical protein